MVIKQKCDVCGRLYKYVDKHKLNQHAALAAVETKPENSSSAPALVKLASPVRFVSSRSPGLTIIIRPTRRGFVNTSGGSMETVMEGKSVSFFNGELVTADPEVVEYLNTKYNDRRYPIVNMSKLGV